MLGTVFASAFAMQLYVVAEIERALWTSMLIARIGRLTPVQRGYGMPSTEAYVDSENLGLRTLIAFLAAMEGHQGQIRRAAGW